MKTPEPQPAHYRPDGYGRVKFGDLRPDDLVWSCFTFEFLRHDDPGWDQKTTTRVEHCEYVVRPGVLHRVSDQIRNPSKDGASVLNSDPEPVSDQIRIVSKTTIESWDQLAPGNGRLF